MLNVSQEANLSGGWVSLIERAGLRAEAEAQHISIVDLIDVTFFRIWHRNFTELPHSIQLGHSERGQHRDENHSLARDELEQVKLPFKSVTRFIQDSTIPLVPVLTAEAASNVRIAVGLDPLYPTLIAGAERAR